MSSESQRRPLIARFLSRMAIGGVQTAVIETLALADRERYEFAVVCYKKAGKWAPRIKKLQIPLYTQKTLPVWDPYQIWRLSRLIRRIRPDIMHVQLAPSFIPGATAARLAGVKRVILQYESMNEKHWAAQSGLLRAWERKLTLGADALVAVSQTAADSARSAMRLQDREIEIVPNGVNFERFASAAPLDLHTELGLDPQTPIIGHVARFLEVKRIEDFIDSAAIVGRERLYPSARPKPVFVVIGDGPDHLGNEYKRRAENVRDDADVRFLGGRDDLPSLLPKLDIGVLVSEIEGCPLTLLEYMCARLPTVATDIPSIAAIARDGLEALHVPVRTPEALARAIARLLQEKELADKLVRNAWERVKAYDWHATQSAYERIYERLLSGR